MAEEKKEVKKEVSEKPTESREVLEKEIEKKKQEIKPKEVKKEEKPKEEKIPGEVPEPEKKEEIKEEKKIIPDEKIEDVKTKIEAKGKLEGVETKFKINVKPEKPKLPEVTDKTKLDVKYALIEPYASAHLHWDEKEQEVIYDIIEPELDKKEKEVLKTIEEGIEELINISFLGIKTPDAIIAFLEKNIKVLLNELGIKISEESFLKLMYYVYRDFVGLNVIEPLMKDYFIEDIECNGIEAPLYIVHRKYRNIKTNIVYKKIEELTSFVEKLAQKCGKYISYASPVLDAALPDGSRVNATYSQEITSRGPTFTIRKFTREPWSPVRLMEMKTVSPEILAYLWLLVEHEANVMVIGGTGSGKTTFINVLAFFIPPQSRVVTIEDTRELSLVHENWLPSVARPGMGAESKGEISLFDLLRASFRQRPDYIIVGEIRGKEAFVLFQGMSAGHPSMGTMHADDVETMIRRLETPPINLSPTLVESMDAVVVMTQAKYKATPVRRVAKVTEIVKIFEEKGKSKTNIPFIWDPRNDKFFFKLQSFVFDKLVTKHGLVKEELLKEFSNRTKLLVELYNKKIIGFEEVQKVIHDYYKNKEEVLKKYGIK